MDSITKVKDLLDESSTLLDEMKDARKMITGLAKDAEASLGADPSTLKRCKDIYYNKGKGWMNGNPLSLDKDAKEKDKLSPMFIKLRDTIVDLQDIGHTNWLNEYFTALESYGIHVTIDERGPNVSDTDEVEEVVKSMVAYQQILKDNSEEIKEDHSLKSEEISFTSKKLYPKAAGFYKSISNPKRNVDKTDDAFQQKIADLTDEQNALTVIYDNFKS